MTEPIKRPCYYCEKPTAWVRSLNGIEIPVCYDCKQRYDQDLEAQRHQMYANKTKKRIVVIPS